MEVVTGPVSQIGEALPHDRCWERQDGRAHRLAKFLAAAVVEPLCRLVIPARGVGPPQAEASAEHPSVGPMKDSGDLSKIRVGEGAVAEDGLNKCLEQLVFAVPGSIRLLRLVVFPHHAPGEPLAALEIIPPRLTQGVPRYL